MATDVNICNGLEIVPIHLENPYQEMYLLQQRLQLRLNPEAYQHNDTKLAARNCTYWFYCIAAECKELMDWFSPTMGHNLGADEITKEIQMESIDVLHFVMNIGLELRYTPEELQAFMFEQPTEPLGEIQPDKCEVACSDLMDRAIRLIDALPWKSWKTYPDINVLELKSLVEEDFGILFRLTIRLCNVVNLSGQDVINWYFAKNAENHNRQDNGY
jgi:hypothetical protein